MIAPPLPTRVWHHAAPRIRYRVVYSFVPAGAVHPVEYSLVVESAYTPTLSHPKLRAQVAERGAKLVSVEPLPYVTYDNMGNVTQESPT